MAVILVLVMSIVMMGLLTGCTGEPSTDKEQTKRTNSLMEEADRQVGLPNITEFNEKKMAKKIFELRDNSKLIILRPFIGDPKLPFVWFRGREANIFIDFFRTLGKLLGG